MLTREEAKSRLAEWQLLQHENRVATAVRELPASLRDTAEWLLDLNEDDEPRGRQGSYYRRAKKSRTAAIAFDRMSAKQRKKVFDILAPSLAPALEDAWQLIKKLPYQGGSDRRAFRAPHQPVLAAAVQASFLEFMAEVCGRYPASRLTAPWLASWTPHLDIPNETMGILLAAVLNRDSAESGEVFEILRQSLTNQHEIGGMGAHVLKAFLLSNREDGWELVEKTLLAAQRQEGLRQSILESIDESHPTAFRRMLRLILYHDLTRFSATVRAIDVWFGNLWSATSIGVFNKMLAQTVSMLEDPAAQEQALSGQDAQAAFLALWCAAIEDADASIPMAEKLLSSNSVELRYVAVVHLTSLKLKSATKAVSPALDDEDLRVAVRSLAGLSYGGDEETENSLGGERFERLERLVDRLPAKAITLKPLVWPWTGTNIKQAQVSVWLLETLGNRPAMRLIPHLEKMDASTRLQAIARLIATEPWDAATRRAVMDLAGDSSAPVRDLALAALIKRAVGEQGLTLEELSRFADYLTRKSSDLRCGILELLVQQEDAKVLSVAQRLLAARNSLQRVAGLELLRELTEARRLAPECKQLADSYRSRRFKLSSEEQSHLASILSEQKQSASLADALGSWIRRNERPGGAARFEAPLYHASRCRLSALARSACASESRNDH